jgi:hypothetical protein
MIKEVDENNDGGASFDELMDKQKTEFFKYVATNLTKTSQYQQ